MTYKEEGMKAPKTEKSHSMSNEAVKAATKLGLRKKCSLAAVTSLHHETPVEFGRWTRNHIYGGGEKASAAVSKSRPDHLDQLQRLGGGGGCQGGHQLSRM